MCHQFLFWLRVYLRKAVADRFTRVSLSSSDFQACYNSQAYLAQQSCQRATWILYAPVKAKVSLSKHRLSPSSWLIKIRYEQSYPHCSYRNRIGEAWRLTAGQNAWSQQVSGAYALTCTPNRKLGASVSSKTRSWDSWSAQWTPASAFSTHSPASHTRPREVWRRFIVASSQYLLFTRALSRAFQCLSKAPWCAQLSLFLALCIWPRVQRTLLRLSWYQFRPREHSCTTKQRSVHSLSEWPELWAWHFLLWFSAILLFESLLQAFWLCTLHWSRRWRIMSREVFWICDAPWYVAPSSRTSWAQCSHRWHSPLPASAISKPAPSQAWLLTPGETLVLSECVACALWTLWIAESGCGAYSWKVSWPSASDWPRTGTPRRRAPASSRELFGRTALPACAFSCRFGLWIDLLVEKMWLLAAFASCFADCFAYHQITSSSPTLSSCSRTT